MHNLIFGCFLLLQPYLKLQYAGFLAVILIVELTLAVSLYTYKDHLTGGLRKGLNQSLHHYGPNAAMPSADFDAMQENVSFPTPGLIN